MHGVSMNPTAMALALMLAAGAPALACTPATLAGTWKAEQLSGDTLSADIELTLAFADNGRLGGRAACNRYGAGYRLDGTTLQVTAPVSTKMACPPPLMTIEQRFFTLLQTPLACEVTADGRLNLRSPIGGQLVARRVP